MTIQEWKTMFEQINIDCSETGESVVPLSDVDYYAEQIHNLTEEQDYIEARRIAVALSRTYIQL